MSDRTVVRVKSFEDLVHKVTAFAAFRVQDKVYSPELLVPQLVIDNKDLLTETAMCAAFVLYWGREAARARRWQAQVEAAWRTWRDRNWLDIKHTPLIADEGKPKYPTDSYVEKLLHQQPDYGDWRGRLDDAQEAAENAEAVHLAFQVKADMIKTQQKLIHDEAGGPYHVAEDPRQTKVREPQVS
jgi:hypothetical protein